MAWTVINPGVGVWTMLEEFPFAPVNSILPSITGIAKEGSTLTGLNGGWSGFPLFTRKWKRGGAAIPGATGDTYVPVAADVGSTLSLEVTATNAIGPATATSDPTATVTIALPVNSVLPAITGTAQEDQTLTVTNGTWTGSPTFARKWYANGVLISGATGTTRTMTSAEVGKVITVTVTATNAGGAAFAASLPTSTVTGLAPTLNALGGTFSLAENSASGTLAGALTGTTTGSTLSLFNDAGGRFAVSGTNVVAGLVSTDYETATSHSITIRETLAGATNTPRDTVFTVAVTDVAEGGGLTYSAALPTPAIYYAAGYNPVTTYPITFKVDHPYDSLPTDNIRLTLLNASTLATVLDVAVAAGTGDPTFPGLSSITTGSHTATMRYERGSNFGPSSNTLEHGPDVIAPVMSLPTTGTIEPTTGPYGFTTNDKEGTAYTVFVLTNSAPTALQVEAGQNAAGAAAAFVATLAITSAGAKSATATGLTDNTNYYRFHMHKDVAGNRSAVLAGGIFTTPVIPVTSGWDPATESPAGYVTFTDSNKTATQSTAGSGLKFKGTQVRSTGKYWIEFEPSQVGGGYASFGLIDNGTADFLVWDSNSLSSLATNWSAGWTGTPKIMFVIDFDLDTVSAYKNGVLDANSPIALPGTLVNLRPYADIGSGVGTYVKINTGQATPMGGVPSGATTWG